MSPTFAPLQSRALKQAKMFQDNYKKKICRELISNILARKPKMCSFIEWKELKIVYKRYASLYFCAAIDVIYHRG